MPTDRRLTASALAVLALATPAHAGEPSEGWDWLAATDRLQTEGAVWNDRIGDGKDRWKTGGITQSYIFPEHMLGDRAWFTGRASGLEFNARAVLVTPDNTAFTGIAPHDRPNAQYAAAGLYLRSVARPEQVAPQIALQVEDRAGIELGWEGDPLPLFDVQNAMHSAFATGGDAGNPSNAINAGFLVNLEARRTWRFHFDTGPHDVDAAPFVAASAGMRENSLRIGADFFVGSALEGRTWGSEPATGAVMAAASMPRRGFNWTAFSGGDLGYVATDALLGGGPGYDGPSAPARRVRARLRSGLLLEYDNLGIGFSLNWLSPEFRGQSEGQVIGAIQIKYRF